MGEARGTVSAAYPFYTKNTQFTLGKEWCSGNTQPINLKSLFRTYNLSHPAACSLLFAEVHDFEFSPRHRFLRLDIDITFLPFDVILERVLR
ncbi:hypothetical protein BFJ68_g4319 [Fusarium oxysporum]|uniref:Uncharacterized protein n=1 Tax=Fusarium oxysporum TaxID=5507 RepID=A0A420QKK1_FUSOX|nr:hypothetical protein BFJ71_g3090 [Fusarium oxysporum]RKL18060.1 hypothetical protein BFJ68_g4319 [Fusarium oxysporum]